MGSRKSGMIALDLKPGIDSWTPEMLWTEEEIAAVDSGWESYVKRAIALGIVTQRKKQRMIMWTPAFMRRIIAADLALPGREKGDQFTMQRFYWIARFALDLHLRGNRSVGKSEKRKLLYFVCEAYRIQS